MNIIAQKLRIKGKSQGWLAQRTGIDNFYINKLIKDKIKNPRIETANKIAKALDCAIEDIWSFDN